MERHVSTVSRLLTVFALLTVAALDAAAQVQSYADSFEDSTFNPFWSLTQQYGTITQSTGQNHTIGGSQSAKFTSSFGGQRDMILSHTFPSATKGRFAIWFYDVEPGLETLYQHIRVTNSSPSGWDAFVGVQDYEPYCYNARVQNNTGQSFGPGANCGARYPDFATTSVTRTVGWHLFVIDADADKITLSIDGGAVYTRTGDYSFDRVQVYLSGPYWRPNTVAYFDDFSFTPLPAVPTYNICALYDPEKPVKSGATIPIRVQLCDANGANLSSPSIVLHATGLVQVSTNTSEVVQDAGNANADSDFRYDSALGGSGGYVFNLKTDGLATGTYRLSFTVSGDPSTYGVLFQVK